MRWGHLKKSENVEDRRGSMARAGGAIGLGGIVIALIAIFLGADPQQVMQQVTESSAASQQSTEPYHPTAEEQEMADMVTAVLGSTEDIWGAVFQQAYRKPYEEPSLILFSGQVQSACGFAKAAMGPFYCPADKNVYIDLSFYQDLKNRHGAPGDFAQAYVVAHEVGHHIQNLLGYSDKVHQARGRASKAEVNRLSVRLELQADFLAGVWAHYAEKEWKILERGDVEEALRAANAIGDDRLQKEATGHVVPDSFTHGTSEQRVRWFRAGLESGDLRVLDEFFSMNYERL